MQKSTDTVIEVSAAQMKLDFIECYANVMRTEGVEIDEIIQS